MAEQDKILTHNLESADAPVQILKVAHQNHYDFSKLHRHGYFEVLFFQVGGGSNLIDSHRYTIHDFACYLIYPGQTHLMQRNSQASGVLIQFQLESIDSRQLERLLQEQAWSGKSAVIYENDPDTMSQMMLYVDLLKEASVQRNPHWKETQKSLLHAILFQLCSYGKSEDTPAVHSDFYHFQLLIDEHFKTAHSVRFYLEQLPIGEKRLASLSKSHLGLSPLQVIHQRILLEAKRMLLLGDLAHKEIAFELGFDSASSFSAFVKRKTGKTPSEVQEQMTEIHK